MNRRNVFQSSTTSLTMIILGLGILVFVNILSYRMFKRADLTEKKEYTISESTKTILKNLDDIVNITAYFSQDLPPYHANIRTQVSDILAEYEAYSDGNLKIEFVDPGKDEELKTKLARMGIPEIPLGEIRRDKQEVSMRYMGIAIQYGDNGEVIPFVRGIGNLEYDLTSALLKVKDNEEKVVIWVGDRDTDTQNPSGYKLLQDELNKTYVVRPMPPESLTTIPKRTSLVVVDGSRPLSDRAMFAIDQFLMNDGKVIFMTDAVELAEGQGLSAAKTEQDVQKLLSHYGVTLEPKLVADARNSYATFNSGYVRFRLPYPFWPKIGPDGFDEQSPAVSQLESLVMPWTSPINVSQNDDSKLTFTPLVTTSEKSWQISEPFDLNPQQDWKVTKNDLEKSVIVYEAKGSLSSYFKGKTAPTDTSSQSAPPDSKEEEEVDESADDARFVVIASTKFINNQFISQFPENMMFAQNIIDSFAIGNDLIGIRSRRVTDRPLDFGTDDEQKIEAKKRYHRLMGMVFIPCILIIFGLTRAAIRKQAKKKMYNAG